MSSNILTLASRLGVRDLAVVDAAFESRGMREFYRGYGDAKRFACVQAIGADWFATPADGSPQLIIEPVTADYLEGLKSGGCAVEQPHPRMAA